MKRLKLCLALVAAALLLTSSALAADWPAESKARERFFSGQNVALNLLLQGAGAADIAMTLRVVGHSKTIVLDTYPDGSPRTVQTLTGGERFGLMRPLVNNGAGPALAVKVVGNGAIGYISWKMRRSDNKATRVVGWVLPVAATAFQFKLAADNARLARQLR